MLSDQEAQNRKCNARVQRGGGYCKNPAGMGTDHVGQGRCTLHGGNAKQDPETAEEVAPLLNITVRNLTTADAEKLMNMGTMAMVVARAQLMQRLLQANISTKEAGELTASVQRLDKLLKEHPEIEDPDAAPNTVDSLDAELARLAKLESHTY